MMFYNTTTRQPRMKHQCHISQTPNHTSPTTQAVLSRDTPKQHKTITTPPPQLQRGEKAKGPIDAPQRRTPGKVAAEEKRCTHGGATMMCMACMSRTRWSVRLKNTVCWMRGAERRAECRLEYRVGSSEERGAGRRGRSRKLRTPMVEERERGGRGRWTMRAGGRSISAVPAIPMEVVVAGFPNKGGISVVFSSVFEVVDTWSGTLGSGIILLLLLEVAVRVRCRVAAGSEIVV